MVKKRFAFLTVLLAVVMVFSLALVACSGDAEEGETGDTTEQGGSDTGLIEIPTTEAGDMAMTLSVPGAVKIGETATISVAFINAVAGTLTWSATMDSDALTVTPATEEIAAGDESATAQIACTVSGTVSVKATFVPDDSTVANIEKAASFSVAKKAVTVVLSQESIAWDDDNQQAVTLTATLSGDTAGISSVAWESSNPDVATLSAATSTVEDNAASVTVTKGTKDGSATITATVSYNDGEQDTTATAVCTAVSSTWESRLVGALTFEESSGTTANVYEVDASAAIESDTVSGITATYSTNANQSVEHKNDSSAFEETASGTSAASVTLSFSDVAWSESEGISFSFWHLNAGEETTGADWSYIAQAAANSAAGTAGTRVCFINANYNIALSNGGGNLYPNGGGGTLANGGEWDSLITHTEWAYITVVLDTTGVYFYENGTLICSYTGTNGEAITASFFAQIANNGTIQLFGNNEGSYSFYIDDFILGKGMTAAQVQTLYDMINEQ